jgi:HEPN domain-containing protein
MPNKTYAREWLELARRNLDTARLLFDVRHYNDVIAVDIHQTIEKSFRRVIIKL